MIDIETGDKDRYNSPILSVGFCKFDPCSNADPADARYWKLDIDAQLEVGRDFTDDTLEWWAKQDKAVRDETFDDKSRIPLADFYKEFNKLMVGVQRIWAQGIDFDLGNLHSLAQQTGNHINWQFWQQMDSRTAFNLMPSDPRKSLEFDAHNAMADALAQAVCIQQVCAHFNIKELRDLVF